MTDGMAAAMAGMSLLGWLFIALLFILWIALPFAVFGIKKRLDAILMELRRINDVGRR